MRDFFDSEFNISVFTASGVEKALKSELKRLGYGEIPVVNGEATLKGNAFDAARLNLNLRTADRVYILLASFKAESFEELFDGVYKIEWQEILPKDALFVVDGRCVKSKLFAISTCQSIVKKAVAKKLGEKYGVSVLPENGAEYGIIFRLFKDQAEILLNTSGVGLHKRGYRDKVWIAPIKETLASALVLYSDFYWEKPFIDPFCGSGTIAIEAAKIALNIPGSDGRNFAFEKWDGFNEKYLRDAKLEAKDKECRDRKIEIFGFDIDPKAISLSKRHAERAGLFDKIKFSTRSVSALKSELSYGTVVTNPPYGERVIDKKSAEHCAKEFGTAMKSLDGWSSFVITSDKGFEKKFGRRADRIRKLYNSEKECNFYYFYGKKEK